MSLNLADLQTEAQNARTVNISNVSTLQMCHLMNEEDARVALAVRACVPQVAEAIDIIVPRVRDGGRVIYLGAGTSGRKPTFSAPPTQFVGIIAGGDRAIRSASEGAEDSEDSAVSDLSCMPVPVSKHDVVVGLAASGRTPYVLGGLKYGRTCGAATVGIACVQPSAMRGLCDVLIECLTGPEVVTGSTRMKAGTATKMILNMVSTGTQIKLGKTHGNLMVDLQLSNEKLKERARRIFRAVVPSSRSYDVHNDSVVDDLFAECGGALKLAILVASVDCSPEEGTFKLQKHHGVLDDALREEPRL